MATKKATNRREFISTSLKGGLAITVGLGAASPLLQSFSTQPNIASPGSNTGFDQQPLPYKYDALENVIDSMTMEIHYSKHAAAYSKNVKEAALAEKVDTNRPLEEVLAKISSYSAKMRNNGGGHYNHEMFWQCMQPKREGNAPTGSLQLAIGKTFGSLDAFKKQFSDAGKNRFGSGWAWLYMDKDKNLRIGSTPNQDNPLMDISDIKGFPLLALDVWEHAYYLKYQNKRADYIDNWWNVVNWNYVQERFDKMS
ncbi:MAG: superoxide dismutase [Ferruginibacter sp.]|nr:superoxide dismutase [Ferruginibacter sp.]HQY11016.1 superoxide dismutase [Ferruginibacter sp.]